MATSEDNSSLFPIFILTIMALFLVPYTITKLCRAASKKTKDIHCQCSSCLQSGKYHRSIFKRVSCCCDYFVLKNKGISLVTDGMHLHMQISTFSTCSNLTLVLLWVIMGFLVYYIQHISHEVGIMAILSS